MYELLCDGKHAYPMGRPMLGEQVIDPSGVRPHLADGIRAFLVRACSPNRQDRYTTAQEMRDALVERVVSCFTVGGVGSWGYGESCCCGVGVA